MSAPARYLFDDDFGAPKKPAEPEVPTLALADHIVEVRKADEAAFLRGVAEGRRQAEADEAARTAGALQRLTLLFADAAGEFQAVAQTAERQAAVLAVTMAKKLAGALVERYPLAEIEAVARSVFGHLRAVPHVVVRVEASLVDAVKPRIDRVAAEAGFAGAVMVLGEPDIRVGDARIEWADGAAVRDSAALERVLDEVVRRYIEAARAEDRP
jgi:flagellar assembly protein FliH